MVEQSNPETEEALELVKNQKISQIADVAHDNLYMVTGRNSDYLVMYPNFCTCEQFILRCLKSPGSICYHILAVQMSKGKVKKISDVDWKELLFREH